ncbi:EAL domain-containing protein [Marinobacterium rhizophilum]|nr:EAL domain-containing protein [Marinobacterium rhizophilum]
MVVSPQGRILWVNEAFGTLSGCGAQDAAQRAVLSYFPQIPPQSLHMLETALSSGTLLDIEVPFCPVIGAQRWVRLQSRALPSDAKTPQAYAWFFTDVTDEHASRTLFQLRELLLDPVSQIRPMEDQLEALAVVVQAQLPGVGVCIQLLEKDGRRLRAAATAGLSGHYLKALDEVSPGDTAGPAYLAVQRVTPVQVKASAALDWGAGGDVLLSMGFASSLSCPLVGVGKVLGCLDFYFPAAEIENSDIDEVIATAVGVTSLAVQRCRDRERLRMLSCGLQQASLAMAIMDARGQVADINDCFEAQTGFGRGDIVGRHVTELYCGQEGEGNEEGWRAWCEELLSSSGFEGECELRRKNGSHYWAEMTSTALRDARGDITHYVTVLKDVTERKESEAMLHQMAFFDPMTGLPNRRLLLDRLEMVLASGRRHRRVSALIFVDLDRFKRLNDVFGHSVGDTALTMLSRRLLAMVREQDTVARLGGDEFVVMLPDVGSSISVDVSRTVRRLADKLLLALREPFDIDGHLHHLQASMGITLLPKGLETAEDLLREADIALYRSKATGLGEVTFFEAGMQLQVKEFADLERDLRYAIKHGELFIYLQPQVDRDGQMVAAEALTRWCHPVRGFIAPVDFIPVAEESGLIVELGAWVFEEVCKLSVRMNLAGHGLPLSVNVSLRQFRQPGFVLAMRDTLRQTGAEPAQLVLEITESLLGDDMGDVVAVMSELSQLGLQFSIDDFGTGYSNLARLKQMPLSEIKIDKSFLQDLTEGNNDAAIVEAILGIAKNLRLLVVAEGVETQSQADFLRARGCDRLQGYLYARPEPAEVVLRAWLEPTAFVDDVQCSGSKVQ